ncbi:MAG: peptidoglycan-binding domain-containing protein [Kiloniellales bacterium]
MSGDADDSKGGTTPGPARPAGRDAKASEAKPGPAKPVEDAKPSPSGSSSPPEAQSSSANSAASPPAQAGAEAASVKKRKKPAQRKSVKRKAKAKSGAVAAAPGAATASPPAKASNQKTSDKKAPGKKAEDKTVAGVNSPADSGRPIPPQAISTSVERSAASSEPTERSGSGLTWLVVLVVALVAAVGYWVWQGPGQNLEQKITQRLAQAQGSLQDVIATVTGRLETPDDATPAEDQQAQTEEVELPEPPALSLSQIFEMEELLARFKLDPGSVDGIVDERTREAISQFQDMVGLPVDGEPSEELLAALREVAGFQGDGS